MQMRLMLLFLPGMCHKFDNEGKNSENVLSQEMVIRFCSKWIISKSRLMSIDMLSE